MEKHDHFDDLFDVLYKTYIAQYQEFDETGHCYYSVEHIVPVENDRDVSPQFHLVDAKSGKVVHSLLKEKDFDYFTTEEINSLLRVTIHLKSGYHYLLYAKKLQR